MRTVAHPVDRPRAALRAERAVEHGQVLGGEIRRVLDRLVLVDVLDDLDDLRLGVAELAQRHRHGAVHDLEEAAADQLLVLDQCDVGLHARRIAVHHERDRAGRREHGDLRVLVAVQATRLERLAPARVRGREQIRGHARRGDRERRVAVHRDHVEERLAVHAVARERPHRLGDLCARRVRLPAHHGRDRGGEVAALVAVVGQAERHQQRAQVRVSEPERAVQMTVARDRGRRIRGVIDEDLLREDRQRGGAAELLHVEAAVGVDELHQVEAREIARRVVEEHVLGAGIARVDAPRRLDRIPAIDRRVVLDARIAAHVRASAISRSTSLASSESSVSPVVTARVCHFAAVARRLHEAVGDAHGVVRILEEDGVVGAARDVEAAVVARSISDQAFFSSFDLEWMNSMMSG
jgi:hypothetical protein